MQWRELFSRPIIDVNTTFEEPLRRIGARSRQSFAATHCHLDRRRYTCRQPASVVERSGRFVACVWPHWRDVLVMSVKNAHDFTEAQIAAFVAAVCKPTLFAELLSAQAILYKCSRRIFTVSKRC